MEQFKFSVADLKFVVTRFTIETVLIFVVGFGLGVVL